MANKPKFEEQTLSNTDTREKHVPKMAEAGVSNSNVNTQILFSPSCQRCALSCQLFFPGLWPILGSDVLFSPSEHPIAMDFWAVPAKSLPLWAGEACTV